MKERSDVELVIAAQNGDEQALAEIFERYQKSLYFTAYKITNHRDDAQDALQETFLQVTKSIKSLKRPEYLKLWLNRIVAGKCRDIFRRNKTVSMDMENQQFQYRYVEERMEFLPEHQMHFESDKAVIDYYIAQLPYAQREAIVLTYFQHLTMQEIAELLDESVGTIKSRIHLAKKTLAKRLQAYENREGVKLNFKESTLGALVITALSSEYEQMPLSCSLLKIPRSTWSMKHILSLVHTVPMKIAICTVLGLSLSGVVAYYDHQNDQADKSNDVLHAYDFVFQDQVIQSDRNAYFLLMNWAMSEEQLKYKSEDEITLYRPLYEYLKKHNSAYYQTLKTSGFADILETYFYL